jgi:hypothetical protein
LAHRRQHSAAFRVRFARIAVAQSSTCSHAGSSPRSGICAPKRTSFAETNELRAETRDGRAGFLNELRAQNERGDALMDEIRREMRITREVIRRNEIAFRQGGAILAELVEQVRAQTKAIFEVLDRLNGGAATA